jgi:phospholipase C
LHKAAAMSRITRRSFLMGSLASLAACRSRSLDLLSTSSSAAAPANRARPDKSRIKHIVVLMMENRSFDHLLGWHPTADAMQEGLTYFDAAGNPVSTFPLAPDFQGCAYEDPDHSWEGGRITYNNGACDGWLLANPDPFSIGYYREADLPFLARAALDWTLCDRYFSAIMAPTFPNKIYQHAAVTDRLENTLELSTLPTIWDRLAARGLRGNYYFSDFPFLSLWGPKYAGITRTYDQFLTDCATGDLPHVAFVDPRFAGEELGTSGDDHPHGDIREGEAFMARTYRAITNSPAWKHTVFIINFDEWGGFFDHVAPSTAPDVDPRFELRGFRVPAIVMSPYARRNHVASGIYDHASVLKMIETQYDLAPLSARDAAAASLGEVLDLSQANLHAPQYSVPDFESPLCPIIL